MTYEARPTPAPLQRLDHLAVAVWDIDAAIPYYRDALGMSLVGDELADGPGVRLAYLSSGASIIQLVQPTRPGPVQDFLKRHGEGLHHFCYEVDSIPATLERLGHTVPEIIGIGGRDRRALFLEDTPEGVRIELTERDPWL